MPSIWLALLLLATAEGTVEPPPRGRLCIGDAKTSITEAACSDTSAATIAVKPADRERRFFWLSADAKTAFAGVVAPKAESIVLDPKTYSAVDTAIDGDATRGWPLDVTMKLGAGPDPLWQWKLDRDAAKRLRRLYVPRGTYFLTASAEHHRTQRGKVVAGAEPAKLEIRFVPLLLARGVVIDAEDRSIADAAIAFPDETLCATANEQGAFTCELPELFPEALVVSRRGYTPREIAITGERFSEGIDVGRVRLSVGYQLTLKIVQPEPAAARVSLLLDGPRYKHSKLKTTPIKEREEIVRFDAAEGRYLVVVEGDGPLERLEVPLTMKNADAEHEIHVEPFELMGSVRFGDDPLSEGAVEVMAPQHTWRVSLPLTGGAFSTTMWQRGVVRAWVSGPALAAGQLFASPELGDDPSRWDIRIDKRMIVGRVFDAATKAPLTTGSFEVVGKSENSESYFTTDIKPDGSYQILAHTVGTYTIRIAEPGFMPYSAELRVTPQDGIRTHDIALEKGILQPIDVVIPAGPGIPKALVLEGVKPDRSNPEFMSETDERGRYELRGLPGQSRLLYFVPRQGSFAVARITLPRDNAVIKPLQIAVPPPSCSLRVHTVASNGQEIPASLLIRYNGEFVPPAIHRFVTGLMVPAGEVRLARLPAGAYELWAVMNDEDELGLIASGGSLRPPVRVGLSGGEQEVTVPVQ